MCIPVVPYISNIGRNYGWNAAEGKHIEGTGEEGTGGREAHTSSQGLASTALAEQQKGHEAQQQQGSSEYIPLCLSCCVMRPSAPPLSRTCIGQLCASTYSLLKYY